MLIVIPSVLLILYVIYAAHVIHENEAPPELEMQSEDTVYSNKFGERYNIRRSFFVNMPESERADYNRYEVYSDDGRLIYSRQGGEPQVRDIFCIGETADPKPVYILIIQSGEEYLLWREEADETKPEKLLPYYLYGDSDMMNDILSDSTECGGYEEVFELISENRSAIADRFEDMGYSCEVFEGFCDNCING
ncbi:MAG: hypothetical protein ACI4J5_00525 [Oscillospiraceae bacterium]